MRANHESKKRRLVLSFFLLLIMTTAVPAQSIPFDRVIIVAGDLDNREASKIEFELRKELKMMKSSGAFLSKRDVGVFKGLNYRYPSDGKKLKQLGVGRKFSRA